MLFTALFVIYGKIAIPDDESYFNLTGSNVKRKRGYHSRNRKSTPPLAQCAGVRKLCQPFLVWAAISEKGVRKVEVLDQVMINQAGYLKVLNRKLKRFIEANHESVSNVVFGLMKPVPMTLDGLQNGIGKNLFRHENCKSAELPTSSTS